MPMLRQAASPRSLWRTSMRRLGSAATFSTISAINTELNQVEDTT